MLGRNKVIDSKLYTFYPDYEKTWKYVLDSHIRSKSVHLDLRIEIIKNKQLIGYTLAAILRIPREAKNLEDAKIMINQKLPKLAKDFHDPNSKFIAIKKKIQPYQWINVDNATFAPGEIGTTSKKAGYMHILDFGNVEFGTLKQNFSEYWFTGNKDLFTGKFIIRSLPNIWKKKSIDEGTEIKTGKGSQVLMATFADVNDPYVLSNRAVRKHWMPPDGVPALPTFIRKQILNNFHYWNYKGAKAQKIRDNLVAHNKNEKVVYGNKK